MENNEFKKAVNTFNKKCFYIHDITKIEHFDFGNNLLDEKSYENILIYDISYKTLIGPKPFPIRLEKVDSFVRVHNRTR